MIMESNNTVFVSVLLFTPKINMSANCTSNLVLDTQFTMFRKSELCSSSKLCSLFLLTHTISGRTILLKENAKREAAVSTNVIAFHNPRVILLQPLKKYEAQSCKILILGLPPLS